MNRAIFRMLLAATVIMLSAHPVFPQENDHPLINRYPASALSKKVEQDFMEYTLITGLDEKGNPEGKTVAGRLTRLFYYNPKDRSNLEIYRNYEQALKEAGMEELFGCADKECGPAYAASAWNRLNGITTKSGSDCQYLAGKLTGPEGEAYVAIMVGRHRHQIDILEVKSMESGLVAVNAEAMAASIDRLGYVPIYGIYFDTGKSELKPESGPTLEEIAKLLSERPSLKLYVVGHTDNVGTFPYNMGLSNDRANAVVSTLVSGHGIETSRLSAQGVGPLSPRATNSTDEGRSQNRRVELVAQ